MILLQAILPDHTVCSTSAVEFHASSCSVILHDVFSVKIDGGLVGYWRFV